MLSQRTLVILTDISTSFQDGKNILSFIRIKKDAHRQNRTSLPKFSCSAHRSTSQADQNPSLKLSSLNNQLTGALFY